MEAQALARSKAYITQYISLILIILCVTVGSLLRPQMPALHQEASRRFIESPQSFSMDGLQVLKVDGKPDVAAVFTLTDFLRNHDLEARISLGAGQKASAVELFNRLLESGAPRDSIEVRFKPGSPSSLGEAEARIELTKLEPVLP